MKSEFKPLLSLDVVAENEKDDEMGGQNDAREQKKNNFSNIFYEFKNHVS